jgi:hypothetical protein
MFVSVMALDGGCKDLGELHPGNDGNEPTSRYLLSLDLYCGAVFFHTKSGLALVWSRRPYSTRDDRNDHGAMLFKVCGLTRGMLLESKNILELRRLNFALDLDQTVISTFQASDLQSILYPEPGPNGESAPRGVGNCTSIVQVEGIALRRRIAQLEKHVCWLNELGNSGKILFLDREIAEQARAPPPPGGRPNVSTGRTPSDCPYYIIHDMGLLRGAQTLAADRLSSVVIFCYLEDYGRYDHRIMWVRPGWFPDTMPRDDTMPYELSLMEMCTTRRFNGGESINVHTHVHTSPTTSPCPEY